MKNGIHPIKPMPNASPHKFIGRLYFIFESELPGCFRQISNALGNVDFGEQTVRFSLSAILLHPKFLRKTLYEI